MTLAAAPDTRPLIDLAEIDSLDLLSAFGEMYIPGTVYQELEAGDVPKGLNELRYELVEPNVLYRVRRWRDSSVVGDKGTWCRFPDGQLRRSKHYIGVRRRSTRFCRTYVT